jgi:hypothetical protein
MRHNVEDLFLNRCKPRSSNQGFAQRTIKVSVSIVKVHQRIGTYCHATVTTVESIGSCVNANEVAARLASGALWYV